MAGGVYLLTTLDLDSTLRTVALYLMVTGFGLGLIMPTVTLAIQTTVDKSLLGVATSATQFIRSLGSTVGTAVIGSLVTKGYADSLKTDAPPQAPDRLISALENPQALVSDEARDALSRAASAFPGGEQVVDSVVQVARESLSGSIHDGFVFTFGAVCTAVVAAVLIKGVRLEEKPVAAEPVLDPNDSAALTARLAEALRKDPVHGSGDEAFVALVSNVNGADTPLERERASAALSGLAQRIESGNGDYPALVHAAAELANGQEGDERERAVHVSRTVIRPLAEDLGVEDRTRA